MTTSAIKAIGYAAAHSFSDLEPFEFELAAPKANEVQIKIEFCGVCHSDVHQIKNEWKNTLYPCLPGHEIIGHITQVGEAVSKYKVGDRVGVGCMVDSCHVCPSCQQGLEQYCESEQGFLATYNSYQRKPSKERHTFGGYSNTMVVREDFVLRIPDALDSASAAPLLCAGVTTFSPLKHWKVGPGSQVGVIGLGGLGQMAVKIAKALGADVTVITTSKEKAQTALSLGAHKVVLSTDEQDMRDNANSLEFILSTIPQPHDANVYFPLLKRDGVLTIVGCIAPLKAPLDLSKILIDRKSLGTSLIGGIAETQQVLEFCAEHGIRSDIELISVDELNEAVDRIDSGEIPFRYVIDMATLPEPAH